MMFFSGRLAFVDSFSVPISDIFCFGKLTYGMRRLFYAWVEYSAELIKMIQNRLKLWKIEI